MIPSVSCALICSAPVWCAWPSICITPGKIEMRKAAAESRFRRRKHLRRLKAVLAADQKASDVRGDVRGRQAAIHIVVAARAIGFQKRLISAGADGDQRNVRPSLDRREE